MRAFSKIRLKMKRSDLFDDSFIKRWDLSKIGLIQRLDLRWALFKDVTFLKMGLI